MKAPAILIISLIGGLSFPGCNDTQSSSGPLQPTELEKQEFYKKPQEITITTLLCAGTDPSTGNNGTWEVEGLFEDMGDASSRATGHGSPEGPNRMVDGELVLVSPVGTIIIHFQERILLPAPEFPVLAKAEGTWVILRGTGGYSNLRGEGTISIELRVDVEGECGGPPNLKIPAVLTGTAHFAP